MKLLLFLSHKSLVFRLSLVFSCYSLVNYHSLLFQVLDTPDQIYEFKMGPSIRALVSEAPFLISFVLRLLSVQVAVIEHVDAYKVGHLVVHLFPFAKLKGQILVFFIFLRLLGVLFQILEV